MYELLKELCVSKARLGREYVFCSKSQFSKEVDYIRPLVEDYFIYLYNHIESILKAHTINVYSAVEDTNKMCMHLKYFDSLACGKGHTILKTIKSVQTHRESEFRACLYSINNKILIYFLGL